MEETCCSMGSLDFTVANSLVPGSLGAQGSGWSTLWLWMCPQAAVTVKTMLRSWPARTDVPRPVYLERPCWEYGPCKSDMPIKWGGFRRGWFQVTHSALLLRSWGVCRVMRMYMHMCTHECMHAHTHTHTHTYTSFSEGSSQPWPLKT